MDSWNIIYYSDLVFFIFVCMTVVYMGIFAMASMFSHHQDVPKTRKENRFIIFIPAYKNGASAEQTVNSILGQSYPQRLFDVTVIADKLDEMLPRRSGVIYGYTITADAKVNETTNVTF